VKLLSFLFLLVPVAASAQWPLKTREHVDLWLSAFAELDEDTTATVPVFDRGYVDQLALAQNQRGVLTSLDSIHDRLQARMAINKDLRTARVLALDAGTWEEMNGAIQTFVTPEKERRRDRKAPTPDVEGRLSDYFTAPADREWLRELTAGLDGARAQFFHNYWVTEERQRRPVLAATDSLWRIYEPRLQRFLSATRQPAGDIILSSPVGRAGVTFRASDGRTVIAVPYPDSVADAVLPIYVFVHEVARAVATDAIAASTSISERRGGIASRYADAIAVRGGYMLLQKTAPELADGYARYYGAGVALATAFPLPDPTRDAVGRAIDRALSLPYNGRSS
jgi:hypothetical protein